MVRVHLNGRAGQVMNGIGAALVVIHQSRTQALDVWTPTCEGEVAEHVIEGPVLEHHDDQVVNLVQVPIGPCLLVRSYGHLPRFSPVLMSPMPASPRQPRLA